MVCKYCKSPIVKNEPGFGYHLEPNDKFNYIRVFWHTECFQMFELVRLV